MTEPTKQKPLTPDFAKYVPFLKKLEQYPVPPEHHIEVIEVREESKK